MTKFLKHSIAGATALIAVAPSCEKEPPSEEIICIDESRAQSDYFCTMYCCDPPVCGCNGETYDNACEAEAAGVISWEEGACDQAECIDSSRIQQEPFFCTTDAMPVCGCNGETYGNECEAEAAGVTSWEMGACK